MEEEAAEEDPSGFRAAEAPMVEDTAQGAVSVVALLAVGALAEAFCAHPAAMEEEVEEEEA